MTLDADHLLESLPNMVFVNQRGRVTYANQRACDVTGVSRDACW